MSYHDVLNDLRTHLVVKPVFTEGLRHLSKGTEIRILIDDRHETALFFDGNNAQLEDRPARNPDVEFTLLPSSYATLKALPGDDLAAFGIEIVKLILAGAVRVRLCGSTWNVLTKGYLKIIQAAGPDFLKFLAKHGLSGMGKITQAIRNLKR